MTKILITEFINQSSLENLNKKFDVKYDEKLYENEKQLITMIKDYENSGKFRHFKKCLKVKIY